jgi:hypothetical protein
MLLGLVEVAPHQYHLGTQVAHGFHLDRIGSLWRANDGAHAEQPRGGGASPLPAWAGVALLLVAIILAYTKPAKMAPERLRQSNYKAP